MNIQEYISSGVLESYVMGELSEQEMRKVQCMALVHEEIAQELKEVEESYELMALQTAVKPSEGLKARIWADIKETAPDSAESAAPVVPMSSAPDVRESSTSFNWAWAAAIAALVGLAGLGYQGYRQDQQMALLVDQNTSLQTELEARLAEINAELASKNLLMADLERDMKIYRDMRFTRVSMAGTDNSPSSLAQIYWDAKSSEVFLALDEMAELPAGKTYQLWALDGGVPVDAGIFSPNQQGLLKMKNIASGQAFAVTIEQEGGAASPSLETLQVIGEVPS